MKIDNTGAGLSPWRRRILPLLLAAVRALVAYVILRAPFELLVRDTLFLSGYAPHWLQYALAALMAVGAVLFVYLRTVAAGAATLAVALLLFEFLWRRVGQEPHGTTLAASCALLAILAFSDWSTRRLQRRIYGIPPN
jgi:hypothetical protein